MFYYFKELTSTIDEARGEKYVHGDVIVAERQTAGRGQRGNRWSSTQGENLTFSIVLDTSFLRVDEQFLLLQAVALSLTDVLAAYGIEARVKWTNDIYVGDRKIAGILIDHSVGGEMLSRSGAGIGLNVNQRVFEEWLPNPTSMSLETGREFDLAEVLERLYGRLMARAESLRDGGREALRREYRSLIYRLDTPAPFDLPDGTRFTGTIRGVGPDGRLQVEGPGGVTEYLFRELSFVIEPHRQKRLSCRP